MKKVYLYLYIFSLFLILALITSCNRPSNSTVENNSDAVSKTSIGELEKISILQTLKANNYLSIEKRVALFHQLKKESPEQYDVENEEDLNLYGYSLLWDEKTTEAIAIFQLVVAEFPSSSNAYDSLGEAYLANGNKKKSLVNYEKSLELNPDNFGAEDQIERLKYPDKIPLTPTEKFAKVFTAKEYKEDLDQLGKKLTEIHPDAFKFITKKNFWKTIEDRKASITNSTTYGEFAWHCNEIIASINCSHTSAGNFYPENELLPLALRFPLQTRWINNQLFVIDPLNNTNKTAIKDEIQSINGIPVSTIIKDIYKHIPSQGYIETTKKHNFNTWSTLLIPYALGFPKIYEIQVKGKEKPIALNKAVIFKDPFRDSSIKRCSDDLCLDFLDNKNAVLTISSFNYYHWNNLKEFEVFMDQGFKKIEEKGVENLIIDLRFNGGGSSESSMYLLRYLMYKPFQYISYSQSRGIEGEDARKEIQTPFENAYKGKLYFIIDGIGNSTTGHFMSLVKDWKLGTIVGEELGSNQLCWAGQTICRLFNTKLDYYVANNTNLTTATSLPDETGILPDHYVTQSIENYLNKVDAVKEFTLELIDK